MSDKNLTRSDRHHSQRKNQANINKRNSQEASSIGNLLIGERPRTERHEKEIEEAKERAVPAKLLKTPFPLVANITPKLAEPEFPPNDPNEEAETPISYPIIITFKTGHAFTLEVHATDTVADVKNKISNIELIPAARQRLKFGGRRLLNNETMSGINVHRGDILEFCLISNSNRHASHMPNDSSGNKSGNCLIYLKRMEGKATKLYVDLAESVKSLKLKIMDVKGIMPRELRLILNGQEMIEINRSLGSYGVHNESTIHFFQMLRGC